MKKEKVTYLYDCKAAANCECKTSRTLMSDNEQMFIVRVFRQLAQLLTLQQLVQLSIATSAVKHKH